MLRNAGGAEQQQRTLARIRRALRPARSPESSHTTSDRPNRRQTGSLRKQRHFSRDESSGPRRAASRARLARSSSKPAESHRPFLRSRSACSSASCADRSSVSATRMYGVANCDRPLRSLDAPLGSTSPSAADGARAADEVASLMLASSVIPQTACRNRRTVCGSQHVRSETASASPAERQPFASDAARVAAPPRILKPETIRMPLADTGGCPTGSPRAAPL